MKKILLFSLSLITLISCETNPIPIEGCTDPNAINYNNQADIDNNTCDFTADILFYLTQSAGGDLGNAGVDKLTFYINGNNIGSQYADNDGLFITAPEQDPPDCFNNYFTTGSVYWEDNSWSTVSLEAIDETDYVWFSETSQIGANECLIVGITSKKLKVYQENN